ncbi:MAG: tyrosine-type recombinase/integrase [Rhizomicrobium sp.]
MPLKIIDPRPGKTPFYSVRGTYLGQYVDRSAKSSERNVAVKFLKRLKQEIERGVFVAPGEPTFMDAAVNYMAATRNERFMKAVLVVLAEMPLRSITQQVVDELAIRLYPKATPATRNRQVHTVVSAVLKYAGVDRKIRRPKGWRGSQRTHWLSAEQAFSLFDAARHIDVEFELFLRLLCYTGMRLSEALNLKVARLELDNAIAYIEVTKNGDPRGVHLPPHIVEALNAHPRGIDRKAEKVFRFTKCGRLYSLLATAKKRAGDDLSFVTFHTLRHTYATWMRRYGKLDTKGLIATGAWRDEDSASRYIHTVASEESRRADLLPVENAWNGQREDGKNNEIKVA